MPAAVQATPRVARGMDYARQILDEKIPACRFVRLACERQLRDLETFKGKDSKFFWDAEAADRVCRIVEHFPHIKGIWATHHKRIELEPWQCFVIATVFGWKYTATKTRRFRVAYSEIPRKNAKSTMTSAIGLYLLACDDEAGAHVVSAANTRDQAKIVFADAQQMAKREAGYRTSFGVEVLAHIIAQPNTASKFEALSAEYSNLDGLNIHGALIDELHAHPTRGVWDILETATGARAQPLIWAITTAGLNRASICYDQRSHVIEVLERRITDDTYFGIIYTIDDGDDPYDEASWRKANPNFGVSIYPTSLESEAKRAQTMPSAQAAFLSKHLNVWVNADTAWLPAGAWDRCADPELDIEDFAGEECYLGIDLALRSDIAALIAAFPPAPGRDYWAVFGRFYLPEQTVNRSENTHYQAWESVGRLVATPGVTTDFDQILDQIEEFCRAHQVLEIALDPFDAGPLVVSMEKRGLPTPVEVRQTAPNLSPAMIEMEGLVLDRRIRHDGDPVFAWMVSNVRAKRTGDFISPQKSADDRKIDAVPALLGCINRWLRRNAAPDFESRGLYSV